MIRFSVLAAAAALIATPAAAQEVRVSLVGKSAEQVHAEISRAAADLCWKQHRKDQLRMYTYERCVALSVDNAVAQIGDAQVAAYAQANPKAWRQYASR